MMLHLAVAQIERTMGDGNDSVNTLTRSFTAMVGKSQSIHVAADNLPESREKDTILSNCQEIEASMAEAIMAFQFYDQLTQRLTHIGNSLDDLARLVADPQRLYNPYEWHGLQRAIRSKYTNEADRRMFDAILGGASIQEALALPSSTAEDGDRIELF
ncbi:hypothetical protein SAMN05421693_12052 [Ectothiorhodospira magna]|uniref:Uncharacterized protein n=2 Tax=Ectothiorhodospira magna TaxID=867345 RepID=A0A1H9E9S8_9GAMM|nr:hypothetical protein SAMN05421693_12052 [Ectothiorhodospira magna]